MNVGSQTSWEERKSDNVSCEKRNWEKKGNTRNSVLMGEEYPQMDTVGIGVKEEEAKGNRSPVGEGREAMEIMHAWYCCMTSG